MASSNNDDAAAELLIREVDDDLKQERLERVWKKYGNMFAAASLALVLAVAGWQGWNTWQEKQRQSSSTRFTEASKLAAEGKRDQAADILTQLANDGVGGYRTLALMRLADLRLQSGDAASAAALEQRVADSSGGDAVYRDLARLKSAYLRLDSADPAEIEKLATPMAAESSPWRHSARELLALAAHKRGDAAKAVEWFRKVADDAAAPQGVRARAAEMLSALGAKTNG